MPLTIKTTGILAIFCIYIMSVAPFLVYEYLVLRFFASEIPVEIFLFVQALGLFIVYIYIIMIIGSFVTIYQNFINQITFTRKEAKKEDTNKDIKVVVGSKD